MKKLGLPIIALLSIGFLTSAATTDYFEIAKYLELFVGVYKNLNSFYVDEIDPEEVVTKGIDAMLADLDPYSDFIPSDEIEQFTFQSTGEYGGIGATIQKVEDFVTVVSPYEGSPADQAGLQAGDIFFEIDGVSAKGKSTEDVVSRLKGKPGTKVDVVIKRGNSTFSRTITRDIIKVKNVVYSGIVGDQIGYIKLSGFTMGAGKEVQDAIKDLESHSALKGIILDLKSNGGGLLSEAIHVTNVFVPKDQTIVKIKTRDGRDDKTYSAMSEPTDISTPVVVLINEGTASASEIVSGTIQDLDRGVIVGRTSFGKGLVQSTRDMSYNTKLKLTTAKYLIPSGRCVQRINYNEKDADGNPVEVPDSLRTAFKTKAGRTVYDGSGITPDREVKPEKFPEISFALFRENLIYDYSIYYKEKHASIASAEDFRLSDADYQDFKNFLADKHYDYKTETEKEYDQLKEAAEDEKHTPAFNQALDNLSVQIQESKAEDLDKYKAEIKQLLEREIAARYYYTAGRIENGLHNDPDLKQAIDILNNQQEYQSILTP